MKRRVRNISVRFKGEVWRKKGGQYCEPGSDCCRGMYQDSRRDSGEPRTRDVLSRRHVAGYRRLGELKHDRKAACLNHGGGKDAGSEEGSP